MQGAGRFKNPGITWDRIQKFALAWEIARIRARNPMSGSAGMAAGFGETGMPRRSLGKL